jgi:hypothetical protein
VFAILIGRIKSLMLPLDVKEPDAMRPDAMDPYAVGPDAMDPNAGSEV